MSTRRFRLYTRKKSSPQRECRYQVILPTRVHTQGMAHRLVLLRLRLHPAFVDAPYFIKDVDMTWGISKTCSSFMVDDDSSGYQGNPNKGLHSKLQIEKGQVKSCMTSLHQSFFSLLAHSSIHPSKKKKRKIVQQREKSFWLRFIYIS